jgi:cell fate (sporulation/competence/biofilm development) regulator YlbF (YheA/YmcA/DUF963 family)
MNEVFKKTRELSDVIMRSDEYYAMKRAEEAVARNESAYDALDKFVCLRRELDGAMLKDEPDALELKRMSDELIALQLDLTVYDEIKTLYEAREVFMQLMNQVNQVLRFIISGEMDFMEHGHSQSCASCGGCRMLN